MYVEIKCPNCFSFIKPDDIDIHNKSAHCIDCDRGFDFGPEIETGIRNKGYIEIPDGISVLKTLSELKIYYPKSLNFPDIPGFNFIRTIGNIVSILFPIAFISSILVFSFGIRMFESRHFFGNVTLLILFIGALGLLMYYWSKHMPKVLNKLKKPMVDCQKDKLHIHMYRVSRNEDGDYPPYVEDKPKKDFVIDTADISQLYVIPSDKGSILYNLLILDKSGNIHLPFYAFYSLNHCLFIEQEIEDFLGIKDERQLNEIKI